MNNICNICGANYIYKNGIWICPACDNIKVENTNEELVLLTSASAALRLANFDEAEERYTDIITKFPNNPEGHWGMVLSKFGIKYEDDIDGKKIPTVYATSIDSVLEDENYKKAVSLASPDTAKYYKTQAEKIEEIRLEWLEKAKKEPPFDIFICFKDSDESRNVLRTEDSYEAQNLYTHLTSLGYKVFFSRESLRDKVSEKYEPYIFNALNTAKVMIVYSSKKEYIESTWVKNEWSRFFKKIKNKQKKENSLVVAYEKMDIKQLPKIFSTVQCMNAGLKTFYSDLEKHIRKVIDSYETNKSKIERIEIVENIKQKKKQIENKIETREIGNYQVEQLSGDMDIQMKTAYKFLSKGLYLDALNIFESILENNPNNGQAILGKTFANLNISSISEINSINIKDLKLSDIETAINYSSKEEATKTIITLQDMCIKQFDRENISTGCELLNFTLKYKLNIEVFHKKIQNSIIHFLKTSNITAATIVFDNYIKYKSNTTDEYLETLSFFITQLISSSFFINAKKYYDKYIEIDPNNPDILWLGILINLNVKNNDYLANNIYKFDQFEQFENILKSTSNEEKRNEYVYTLLDSIIAGAKNSEDNELPKIAKIFDKTLTYTKANSTTQSKISSFAKICKTIRNFNLAEKYYTILISENERDHKAYWGLLQSKLKVIDDYELVEQPIIITTLPEFHSAVMACGDDEKSMDKYIELKAKQIRFIEEIKVEKNASQKRKKIKRIIYTFSAIIISIILGLSGISIYNKYNNELIYTLNSTKTGYIITSANSYNDKNLTIPAMHNNLPVVEIGDNAFKNKDIESVSIPSTITKIGNSAFANCSKLVSIYLRQSIVSQESNNEVYSFISPLNNYIVKKEYKPSELQYNSVTKQWEIHNAIDIVSDTDTHVYAVCDGIVTSLYNNIIDGYVVEIKHSNNLFTIYKSLSSTINITLGQTIKSGDIIGRTSNLKKEDPYSTGFLHFEVIKNGIYANPENLINKTFYLKEDNNSSTSVITANCNITTIGKYAFDNCTSLEVFPDLNFLETIEDFAFSNCKNLNSSRFPYTLKSIGEGAFFKAFTNKENEITIPSSVTSIGKKAFYDVSEKTIIKLEAVDLLNNSDWHNLPLNNIKKVYSISLDGQGSDNLSYPYETKITFGEKFTLPTPTQNGYSFLGWFDGLDEDSSAITDDQGQSINAFSETNIKMLYAKWSPAKQTITFHNNCENKKTIEQICYTGESVTLLKNQFTNDGYDFVGWATSPKLSTISFYDEDTFIMSIDSLILYAIWEKL